MFPVRKIFLILLTACFLQNATAQSVLIDPAIRYQNVEGWGGSLCWWANIMGGYSDIDVLKICDWITDPNGLNMNIFRFNIGGGDAPDHQHMRGDGGDMPGYKVAETAAYDWTRDANQRKITLQLIESRTRQTGVNDIVFEAFSNSPPWWMTRSGCSAGSTEGNVANLKADMYDDFAEYLTEVVKYYHENFGITFSTLDPFNEPYSGWWKALGGQEGCYFGQADQEKMIRELYDVLSAKGMGYCRITAMDSNSLDECLTGINAYHTRGDILPKISKINAHSYFGSPSSRKGLAAFCLENDFRLWQSESGPLNMPGTAEQLILAMAARVIQDMKEMKCEAWIDWQIAADQSPQWGLIVGRYNEPSHPVSKGDAFYIRAQFSRFIKAGYTIIDCKDQHTLTALSPDHTELVVVVCNETGAEASFSYDLSAFKSTGPTAIRYRSGKVNDSYSERLAKSNITIADQALEYVAPKYSVTTFIIPVEVREQALTGGRFTIRNKGGNQFVGISGSSLVAGGSLVVTGSEAGMNSRFDIRIDPLNGGYRIIPAHIAPERNYVLDVEGGAATDRAKIMQYQDWGGENQRFHFVHLDGDYYRIVVRRSMKVWSLPDNTFVSGTPVLQMTWNNRDNSVWEVALPLSSADDQLMSKDIRFIYHDSILDVRSLGSENLENIEVFNAAGEVIRQVRDIRNPDYSIRIDGDSGVYFVRAVLANGRTAGNKFIRL
jgi:O-glycosyl hydrolase